jgi:hypothetical protein
VTLLATYPVGNLIPVCRGFFKGAAVQCKQAAVDATAKQRCINGEPRRGSAGAFQTHVRRTAEELRKFAEPQTNRAKAG